MIFVFILRALLVLFLLRMVFRFISGWSQGERRSVERGNATRKLVRDTVCNTYIPSDLAVTAHIAGHEEYFCSSACRERARVARQMAQAH
ncbi:MAG: hypothetical protein MUF51_02995 [Vicinamibacteria bacterium]|jgi:YHS domain-containing protein|nr:hypothetical protein [Vicinamibacteria bacterium]